MADFEPVDEDDRPRRKRRRSQDEDEDKPRRRGRFRCPYCGSDLPPTRQSKVSQAGWVVFFWLAISCIGTLFCWIPLLVMREDARVCADCGVKLGG